MARHEERVTPVTSVEQREIRQFTPETWSHINTTLVSTIHVRTKLYFDRYSMIEDENRATAGQEVQLNVDRIHFIML